MNKKIVAGLTMGEYIKKETAPRIAKLWGVKILFSPVLCKTRIGDGRQLIYFGTLDNRPYWWLILIDSKTDVKNDDFEPYKIWDLIEDEFGRFEIEEEDDEYKYPSITNGGGGCHWGIIANFATGKEK